MTMQNSILAIGIDLGATKIASALVTRDGKVLASRQTATMVNEGSHVVFDRIAAEVRALIDEAKQRNLPPVLGVGIGSPGLIDGERGIVKGAVNMKWTEVPLAHEVSHRANNIPVIVENDAC